MKKLLRMFLWMVLLTVVLSVCALAAEPTASGICNIGGSAALTPDTSGAEIDGYGTYYAGAAKFDVSVSGLTTGNQYLLLVVRGKNAVPKQDNIVYVDQAAAANGGVTFTAYPSVLTKGDYSVYVVGRDKEFNKNSPAATFSYYQPYTLGDVNGDGQITANDALSALQIAVGKAVLSDGTQVTETMELAADVNADDKVTANDALLILQKAVGKDVF